MILKVSRFKESLITILRIIEFKSNLNYYYTQIQTTLETKLYSSSIRTNIVEIIIPPHLPYHPSQRAYQ